MRDCYFVVMKNVYFAPVFLCLTGAIGFSCTSIGEFNTDTGECYVGKIAGADYVRSGTFDNNVGLTLTLDIDTLISGDQQGGGTITTDDGRFSEAPITQLQQLSHDSLSLLQFPGGRIRNFLAFASPTDGGPATVVISLMENDAVEVRILRPDPELDDGLDEALFGVFRLLRRDDCTRSATR